MTQTDTTADLADLADDLARAAGAFVTSVQAVADAGAPDETVSILLLELSSLLAAGAPLGAIVDVEPEERFEPDAGYDVDVDLVRTRLRDLLGAADDYVEVFDPYAEARVVPAKLSDDLADICTDLLHGLSHHLAGRSAEALWWWQFSYVAHWGNEASGALRALQSIVSHDRLDTDIEGEQDVIEEASAVLDSAKAEPNPR